MFVYKNCAVSSLKNWGSNIKVLFYKSSFKKLINVMNRGMQTMSQRMNCANRLNEKRGRDRKSEIYVNKLNCFRRSI